MVSKKITTLSFLSVVALVSGYASNAQAYGYRQYPENPRQAQLKKEAERVRPGSQADMVRQDGQERALPEQATRRLDNMPNRPMAPQTSPAHGRMTQERTFRR